MRRRGFILIVVVMTFGVIAMLCTALARYGLSDLRRERLAALRMNARQLLTSAQAWSVVRGVELEAGNPVELPIAGAVNSGVRGTLVVESHTRSDGTVCAARVELSRGPLTVRMTRQWRPPVAADESAEAAP